MTDISQAEVVVDCLDLYYAALQACSNREFKESAKLYKEIIDLFEVRNVDIADSTRSPCTEAGVQYDSLFVASAADSATNDTEEARLHTYRQLLLLRSLAVLNYFVLVSTYSLEQLPRDVEDAHCYVRKYLAFLVHEGQRQPSTASAASSAPALPWIDLSPFHALPGAGGDSGSGSGSGSCCSGPDADGDTPRFYGHEAMLFYCVHQTCKDPSAQFCRSVVAEEESSVERRDPGDQGGVMYQSNPAQVLRTGLGGGGALPAAVTMPEFAFLLGCFLLNVTEVVCKCLLYSENSAVCDYAMAVGRRSVQDAPAPAAVILVARYYASYNEVCDTLLHVVPAIGPAQTELVYTMAALGRYKPEQSPEEVVLSVEEYNRGVSVCSGPKETHTVDPLASYSELVQKRRCMFLLMVAVRLGSMHAPGMPPGLRTISAVRTVLSLLKRHTDALSKFDDASANLQADDTARLMFTYPAYVVMADVSSCTPLPVCNDDDSDTGGGKALCSEYVLFPSDCGTGTAQFVAVQPYRTGSSTTGNNVSQLGGTRGQGIKEDEDSDAITALLACHRDVIRRARRCIALLTKGANAAPLAGALAPECLYNPSFVQLCKQQAAVLGAGLVAGASASSSSSADAPNTAAQRDSANRIRHPLHIYCPNGCYCHCQNCTALYKPTVAAGAGTPMVRVSRPQGTEATVAFPGVSLLQCHKDIVHSYYKAGLATSSWSTAADLLAMALTAARDYEQVLLGKDTQGLLLANTDARLSKAQRRSYVATLKIQQADILYHIGECEQKRGELGPAGAHLQSCIRLLEEVTSYNKGLHEAGLGAQRLQIESRFAAVFSLAVGVQVSLQQYEGALAAVAELEALYTEACRPLQPLGPVSTGGVGASGSVAPTPTPEMQRQIRHLRDQIQSHRSQKTKEDVPKPKPKTVTNAKPASESTDTGTPKSASDESQAAAAIAASGSKDAGVAAASAAVASKKPRIRDSNLDIAYFIVISAAISLGVAIIAFYMRGEEGEEN